MSELRRLFLEAREWRLNYRRAGDQINALACVIREEAFLDGMKALGATPEEIRALRGKLP